MGSTSRSDDGYSRSLSTPDKTLAYSSRPPDEAQASRPSRSGKSTGQSQNNDQSTDVPPQQSLVAPPMQLPLSYSDYMMKRNTATQARSGPGPSSSGQRPVDEDRRAAVAQSSLSSRSANPSSRPASKDVFPQSQSKAVQPPDKHSRYENRGEPFNALHSSASGPDTMARKDTPPPESYNTPQSQYHVQPFTGYIVSTIPANLPIQPGGIAGQTTTFPENFRHGDVRGHVQQPPLYTPRMEPSYSRGPESHRPLISSPPGVGHSDGPEGGRPGPYQDGQSNPTSSPWAPLGMRRSYSTADGPQRQQPPQNTMSPPHTALPPADNIRGRPSNNYLSTIRGSSVGSRPGETTSTPPDQGYPPPPPQIRPPVNRQPFPQPPQGLRMQEGPPSGSRMGISRESYNVSTPPHPLMSSPPEGSRGGGPSTSSSRPLEALSTADDVKVSNSLSSLRNSAMLAKNIPYISTTAGLLLQVLATQNDVNQHEERWSAVMDKVQKLAALVSNVGRTCEYNKLEGDDLPHSLVTIFQSLVTELGQIERAAEKKGSLKKFFLGVYFRRKVEKYDRKIFNVLQAFHATLAFNQRFSHCAERIEVEVTNVNTRYDEDQTPLHVASQLGQLGIVRSLIARGANPNSENAIKQSPLFMASRNGNVEITQLLLEHRADVNHPDLENRTPLHEASEKGHDSVARLLLRSGANVDARNVYDWTPLHLASRAGKIAVVQVLLDRGAEVNVQNNSKWTPLHMASRKGHVEVVQLLLVRNPRVDDEKADGETALHLAAYYGHLEVVGLLIGHNADRRIRNNKDKTALDLARVNGHKHVVPLFEPEFG